MKFYDTLNAASYIDVKGYKLLSIRFHHELSFQEAIGCMPSGKSRTSANCRQRGG